MRHVLHTGQTRCWDASGREIPCRGTGQDGESQRGAPWPAGLQPDWPVSSEPQVMFTPSGLARPVSLTRRWAEGRQRWQWQADNTLHIATLP